MSDAITLELLAKEVSYLRDRQDVLDCINRYSRALDRHDTEMMTRVYHTDGIDEHGSAMFDNTHNFMKWMNETHDNHYTAHQHHVTIHNCELDGDTAHTESYVIVTLSSNTDPQIVWVTGGRYIDKLERREGQWKIAIRTSVLEWAFQTDGSLFADPAFTAYGFPTGTHDGSDPSYARPLVSKFQRKRPA